MNAPPDPLGHRIAALPASPSGALALDRLAEAARSQDCEPALAQVLADANVAGFLAAALGDSPYLLDLAAKDVRRLAATLGEAPETRIEAELAGLRAARWETKAEAMAALRQAKQNVALVLGLADLARAVPLDGVTGSLSAFADEALRAALRFALADARRAGKWDGDDASHGFFIMALGKYGANELNYSSDIDFIALYDPAAIASERLEPSTFWVRIVRLLVALLQERTVDGYVFRTDLRLRPDPAATPVALSAPAALLYYESMGQNWERAALIKARVCAGDLSAGQNFVAELAPFIWRRYLDFAAVADIHSIKRQVHAHHGHGAVRVLGHDIKRGRGGIREIEFFVQTQQLIAGGRDRTLRGGGTRAMLSALAATGWIDDAARRDLDAAYVFLRTVEHRLQMVNDEQTHRLPETMGELGRIGRLAGFADTDRFEARLRDTLETVARRYSELFEGAADLAATSGNLVFTGGEDDPETIETLHALGYHDPSMVTAAVRSWHFGRFPAMRSTAAREALTEITPALLQALAKAGNPDAAFRAFDALLRVLPAGAQLFALLTNNRDLLHVLATILGAAPRLAEIFAHRPHVADSLIDPASFDGVLVFAGLQGALHASLAESPSFEDALDRVRLFCAEQRFLIAVALLRSEIRADDAGRHFSDLAEVAVAALYARTLAVFERQHGRVAGGQVAILALGRLGSREMTYGSDLDLIVIYDHADDATSSDGARPLPPSQYFTRLTQRLVAALSAPTSEGAAYAVDLRLRPSGRSGPLATRLASFEAYQLAEAWTWEHMALTRARPVAGDAALIRRVSGVVGRIVAEPRERSTLAGEVASMRGRIEREKQAAGPFDVKVAPGGLIDCEFAAQFLLLGGLERRPGETSLQTLLRAGEPGGPAGSCGAPLVAAAAVQSAVLQLLRIADEHGSLAEDAPEALKELLVAAASAALERSGGGELAPAAPFAELFAVLVRAQREARAALERLLGTPIPP